MASLREAPVVVGVIGGGQLGRMMALEAPRLNIELVVLDAAGPACPAAVCAKGTVQGQLTDEVAVQRLVAESGCAVVTAEIEHINTDALLALEQRGVSVQPSAGTIRLIQDKLQQKQHFARHGIPVAPFLDTKDVAAVEEAAVRFGLPLMLKRRRGGYDGRGNAVLERVEDAGARLAELGGEGVYAEAWVPFEAELAVMVVRSTTGEVAAYPTVTAIQQDSVCRTVVVPARCSAALQAKARDVAIRAVASLGDGATGVFGVELFLAPDGAMLLNEIAPRPHNTGHYTQDACAVSQFENHLRAVLGLPLGDTALRVGAAAMVNVLGLESATQPGSAATTLAAMADALALPGATLHWYGKQGCRKGRKMGHINLVADSPAELEPVLARVLAAQGAKGPAAGSAGPLVGVIMGSDSDLPCMKAAVDILTRFGVPFETDIVSAHRTPAKMVDYARSAADRGLAVIIAGAGGAAHLPGMVAAMTPLPVVGVPIKTSTLSGRDSLLSIVQMPRGVPVATVAIGNATNAGLLAVRILAASRPALRAAMEAYQAEMGEQVDGKSARLRDLGPQAYLDGMANKSAAVNV